MSDGTEAAWATVLAWDPPRRVTLAWKPNLTDNPPTELEITFTPDGADTRVDLEHRGRDRLGPLGKQARQSYGENWDGSWPCSRGRRARSDRGRDRPGTLAPCHRSKGPPMPTATFVTNRGSFTVSLLPEHAPKTVANFIDLATGGRAWTDPRDGATKSGALYPGTVFHRVIDGFMIQGGDPTGTGMGGPGYQFEDECPPDGPAFDRPGVLAMANAGPNTNGSQFFVTVAETPWLTGRHTIFGEVTEGYDVVEAISKLPTGAQDRPREDVVLDRVEITDTSG